MSNQPGQTVIEQSPADFFKNLTIPQLKAEYDKCVSGIVAWEERANIICSVASEKAMPQLQAAFDAKGKDHGSLTEAVEGVKMKYNAPMSVSWDSDKLRELVKILPPEKAIQIIEAKLSISEKVYTALNIILGDDEKSAEIKDKIVQARTEKRKPVVITFD